MDSVHVNESSNYSIKFNENDLDVEYVPKFIQKEQADRHFAFLRTLPFYTPTFKICGKKIKPKRQVLAFGDPNSSYAFSGTRVPAEPWSPMLLELRNLVEYHVGCTFNYVLLNLYANGSSYISQHKDDESSLHEIFPIAVLSFGAQRTIRFERPNVPSTDIHLEHGSLYIIPKSTNSLFTHGIAPEPSIQDMRISLTFRHLISSGPFPPLKKPRLDVSSKVNHPVKKPRLNVSSKVNHPVKKKLYSTKKKVFTPRQTYRADIIEDVSTKT